MWAVHYAQRSAAHRALAKVALTGDIRRPMITLHGTIDALLPIRTDSDVYRREIRDHGRAGLHRYYRIAGGTHVDGLNGEYGDRVRPILRPQGVRPAHRVGRIVAASPAQHDGPPRARVVRRDQPLPALSSHLRGRAGRWRGTGRRHVLVGLHRLLAAGVVTGREHRVDAAPGRRRVPFPSSTPQYVCPRYTTWVAQADPVPLDAEEQEANAAQKRIRVDVDQRADLIGSMDTSMGRDAPALGCRTVSRGTQ